MRQLCETRPEPRGSSADAGLGRVQHLDVEAAVRGHGGVGLTVHALVVAPALGPGPGQLNCPEAGLSRGWSWSLVEPVPESLEPVDMSEVRCAAAASRWRSQCPPPG